MVFFLLLKYIFCNELIILVSCVYFLEILFILKYFIIKFNLGYLIILLIYCLVEFE